MLYRCKKAFDGVDRDLMLFKLLRTGINGKLYRTIEDIYSDCKCRLNINGILSEEFVSLCGVRQGDVLSPTLFGIFINDIVEDLKHIDSGIVIDNEVINCLLYADDLALISDTEEHMQDLLNAVSAWSKKWRIKCNYAKCKVVHYRKPRMPRTNYNFQLCGESIDITEQYKYLGIMLHEFLDFQVVANVLANSAQRALGAVIHKYKKLNGLSYSTYTKLFHSCVATVMDYGSEIWGFKDFAKLNTVQQNAIRVYLGLHKFAPIDGFIGDMGWTQAQIRRQVSMIRFWNRLVNMNDSRLTKKVFLHDLALCNSNWSSEIKQVFVGIGETRCFENRCAYSTQAAWAQLHENFVRLWKNNITSKPKLRTYCTFKDQFSVEPYVDILQSRKYRAVCAKIRVGILPLEVETGRWRNIPPERRFCKMCTNNCVEDETPFVFFCDKYTEMRNIFFDQVTQLLPAVNLWNSSNVVKWQTIMCAEVIRITCKYLHSI